MMGALAGLIKRPLPALRQLRRKDMMRVADVFGHIKRVGGAV